MPSRRVHSHDVDMLIPRAQNDPYDFKKALRIPKTTTTTSTEKLTPRLLSDYSDKNSLSTYFDRIRDTPPPPQLACLWFLKTDIKARHWPHPTSLPLSSFLLEQVKKLQASCKLPGGTLATEQDIINRIIKSSRTDIFYFSTDLFHIEIRIMFDSRLYPLPRSSVFFLTRFF